MPRSRLSGDGRKTRRSSVKKKTTKKSAVKKMAASSTASHAGEVHRFIGVSLSGGKSDKACVSVLEYYPKHKKVFLSRLVEKIKSDEVHSADFKILEIIQQYHQEIESVAFDVPFNPPFCLRCVPHCPGIEGCPEEHVKWMWDYTRKQHKKKKPRKLFTPYTQRCVELYLSTELEEPFNLQHAMGANTAPLLARAMFIKRRLVMPCIEVFPKLSVWRVGRSLNVMKSHLRFHKHSIGGDESRREILNALSSHNVAFVYDQDVKLMIENNHAFESFICALTAFLQFKGLTEARPEGFPRREDWIEFPKPSIKWDSF
ncbi:hypothetical protein AZI87_15125 [Bdellovibrio bacteriovorus]|uniref:DUF429 domain-containing protein n=1 Tax=Bdellovibrio bacteriovorus TaxID=959 RepID=A0A161P9X8_BDEBC|nr:DUF429 domain-containing protein [Bdellovibrio bacteriovorus]KYG62624.1 hypothetical protein AZI87_15125 [Bdellovibrio bacteriovorus]